MLGGARNSGGPSPTLTDRADRCAPLAVGRAELLEVHFEVKNIVDPKNLTRTGHVFLCTPSRTTMSCAQMGAMQTRDTCWFYSILNGFILSDEGKKILYVRLKEFYKKLTLNERAYFDDKFNAPCPMKNLVKTKEIYFWKFIDQYLCFLSGPRAVSLKAGKSASVLRNVSLQGSLAKQAQGAKGAFPQDEISKILDHVGFKGAYYIKYADSPQEFHTTRKPQFVVVSQSSASKTYMPKIPAGLMDDPNYELMCATLIVSNKIFAHAVAGFVCNRKGYIYDANQRKVFKCDWWNLSEFKKVVDEEVVKHYTKKSHDLKIKIKTKKTFLYNPKNPKKTLDLFTNDNPNDTNDTIHIKYTTLEDVKTTIDKLEKLYKDRKYPHNRIFQVGMIMKVRLEVLKKKKPEHYSLANKYYEFLKKRTKLDENDRYKFKFLEKT